MSSLEFLGNDTSYLEIPASTEFNFGTGDFTVEWYQYQTDSNNFPRIFQVGSYTTGISIGVSIEGGQFYYWTNGTPRLIKYLQSTEYKNEWVHFAICRVNGRTTIFMNGQNIWSEVDTTNFQGVNNLIVGNESTPSSIAAFGGYMTYFSWVKGVALYTTDFTFSKTYPIVNDKTVLILTAISFNGILGNTTLNRNVSNIASVATGFNSTYDPPSQPVPNLPIVASRKPLFSNNSLVFYKAGSLASGGVGSVRNSSAKARRT
jgi:hypothetical protein